MSFTKYVTSAGDRWDTVAFKAYGDVSRMGDIIAANPDVPITDTLEGGIELRLPIIASAAPATGPENLPPWKR